MKISKNKNKKYSKKMIEKFIDLNSLYGLFSYTCIKELGETKYKENSKIYSDIDFGFLFAAKNAVFKRDAGCLFENSYNKRRAEREDAEATQEAAGVHAGEDLEC